MMSHDQRSSPFVDNGRPRSSQKDYYSSNRNNSNAHLLYRDTSKYFPESDSDDRLARPEHLRQQ